MNKRKKKSKKPKKQKQKLTAAQRRARRERREKYMTVFINGKQKLVPRPPKVNGIDVDEFILQNADPIWLVENEMWEHLAQLEELED